MQLNMLLVPNDMWSLPSFERYYQKVVDAAFVKTSKDGRSCSLRVKMDSPFLVNALFRDAKLLRSTNNELIRRLERGLVYCYADSNITKDRTVAEQGNLYQNSDKRLPQNHYRNRF